MTAPLALVTGAGRRVGRGIALALAAAGHDIVVHYRSSEKDANAVSDAVKALGRKAVLAQGDLATEDGCAAIVDVVKHQGRLDVLVNNASAFDPVPFAQIDDATWRRMLAINLEAPFRLSRDLLPLLSRGPGLPSAPEGQHGVVVHLCDIGADRPISGYAHYSVSKAGLVMLVKAMAVELAPAVRTVGVSPGQVAWPDTYEQAKRDRLTRRIPLHRVGAPQDVASLVRYLVCEGHYLNGVVVPVDGGLSCRY